MASRAPFPYRILVVTMHLCYLILHHFRPDDKRHTHIFSYIIIITMPIVFRIDIWCFCPIQTADDATTHSRSMWLIEQAHWHRTPYPSVVLCVSLCVIQILLCSTGLVRKELMNRLLSVALCFTLAASVIQTNTCQPKWSFGGNLCTLTDWLAGAGRHAPFRSDRVNDVWERGICASRRCRIFIRTHDEFDGRYICMSFHVVLVVVVVRRLVLREAKLYGFVCVFLFHLYIVAFVHRAAFVGSILSSIHKYFSDSNSRVCVCDCVNIYILHLWEEPFISRHRIYIKCFYYHNGCVYLSHDYSSDSEINAKKRMRQQHAINRGQSLVSTINGFNGYCYVLRDASS